MLVGLDTFFRVFDERYASDERRGSDADALKTGDEHPRCVGAGVVLPKMRAI